jgi:hypothetical protein
VTQSSVPRVELALGHPFVVQLTSSPEPGVMAMRAVFVGVLTDAQVLDWSRHLGVFFALARVGGLGGSQTPPWAANSKFECAVQTDDSDPGTLVEWELSGIDVAPEALRILANLFESGVYKFVEPVFPLLTLEYGDAGRLPPRLGFPLEWPDCPFDVEEFPIENEDFDIEVVFQLPLPADLVPTVARPLGAWLAVLAEGGFGGPPYDPVKPGVESNEKLVSVASQSVIMHVQKFNASPEALSSLKNILMAIHHAGSRIERVVIAE